MIAVCTDIDEVAARMCYVQLALLGIPAIVNIGNSLTLDVRQTLHTPDIDVKFISFQILSNSLIHCIFKGIYSPFLRIGLTLASSQAQSAKDNPCAFLR